MKDRKTQFPPLKPTTTEFANRDLAVRTGVPIVFCHTATDSDEWGTWKFRCNDCNRDHIHGAGEGLRSSHCLIASTRTYYLVHHSHANAQPDPKA